MFLNVYEIEGETASESEKERIRSSVVGVAGTHELPGIDAGD